MHHGTTTACRKHTRLASLPGDAEAEVAGSGEGSVEIPQGKNPKPLHTQNPEHLRAEEHTLRGLALQSLLLPKQRQPPDRPRG